MLRRRPGWVILHGRISSRGPAVRNPRMAAPMTTTELRGLMAPWTALWGVPGLEHEIDVRFSTRLTRSVGRCRPAICKISLRADLLDGPFEFLTEVLCHEVAHVAVHRLFGARVLPHGKEWKRLVAAVGYRPRATTMLPPALAAAAFARNGGGGRTRERALPLPGRGGGRSRGRADPAAEPAAAAATCRVWEHRCPVCKAVRFARRTVRRWRCIGCLETARGGELVITRWDIPADT
jgi:hypothetical protein